MSPALQMRKSQLYVSYNLKQELPPLVTDK